MPCECGQWLKTASPYRQSNWKHLFQQGSRFWWRCHTAACATPTSTSGRANTTWATERKSVSQSEALCGPALQVTRSSALWWRWGRTAKGVKVGERRIVFPWIGCGQCDRCEAGEDNMCTRQSSIGVVRHGGFSSHVLVPHWKYLVDPGDLDPAVAATYACSGITVLSAIRKLGSMRPDSAALLIGAGGLGHSAIAMLRALGHRNIVVVDVDENKRAAVMEAGATAFVDGKVENLAAEIVKCAGGSVLYAIDFVNNTKTANAAFNSLGKGGKLVLIGLGGGELDIPLASMVFLPRNVMGSSTGTLQDLKDVVELANSGKLKPIPVDHMHRDQANEALNRLRAGRVTGRVVLCDNCAI
jgi:alcohol dehydrogenase, propanol-preferring